MSFIRDPLMIIGNFDGYATCTENIGMKHSLHANRTVELKPKKGETLDDVVFQHMAEHYRAMVGDFDADCDADKIYYAALQRYLTFIPIFGWFYRRLVWHFGEKYGFYEK